MNSAASFSGKYGRIARLVAKVGEKLRSVNWNGIQRHTVQEKFMVCMRMAKAYANGSYREVPWKTIVIILAALIYFLNPIDIIPDVIPVLGFSDDFAVLAWVYHSIGSEVEKFLIWEAQHVTVVDVSVPSTDLGPSI